MKRAGMSRARFGYHRLTRGRILGGASGFVAVTEEIARSVASYHKPALVLGNGIELAAVRPLPPASGGRASAVLIAAKPDEAWHGLDKLLALARVLPDVDVHVIGQLTAALEAVPPNVTLYGFLGQERYRALLAEVDVGIAPLALHRKHMDEACPLKTREYLALGMPVVAGYRDPDVRDVPHLLELPNREDNVAQHVAAIDAFIARWHGKRVERSAVAQLDSGIKEQARLQFLAACCRKP